MATHKAVPDVRGEVLTDDEVAELDYAGLIAARAAVDARHDGPDPGLTRFNTACDEWRRLTARLEVLAEDDPRVVGLVAAAVARRHPARRTPGDLDEAESALALAAMRASSYPTAAGHIGRGPFAGLTVRSPTTHHPLTPVRSSPGGATDFGPYGTQNHLSTTTQGETI